MSARPLNWVLVRSFPNGVTTEHLNGVAWHDAPKPFRWHRCQAQTRGTTSNFTHVERCACGAIRMDGGKWMERNTR